MEKFIWSSSIHCIVQPKTIVNLYLYLQRKIVIQNPAMNVQCNGKYLKMKALQLLQPHIFSRFSASAVILQGFTTIPQKILHYSLLLGILWLALFEIRFIKLIKFCHQGLKADVLQNCTHLRHSSQHL